MTHKHIGDPMRLCPNCIPDVKEELRGRRFWAYVLVGFALMLAGVSAFVLFKIGTGR